MVRTTKAQRQSIKRIWLRQISDRLEDPLAKPESYRAFRKKLIPTFGMDGAVSVPWAGMWLCIETDGYTHS